MRFLPRITWLRIDLRDAASGLAFVDVTKIKEPDPWFAPLPAESFAGGRAPRLRVTVVGSRAENAMAEEAIRPLAQSRDAR